MSLNSQIVEHLEGMGTPFTTAELAAALDVESKKVSSALSKLVKLGKIHRGEDGKVFARVEDPREDPNLNDVDQPTPNPTPADSSAAGETPTAETADGATDDEPLPAAGSKEFNIDSWKRKIAAMLAKAERTENEHERDAFMKKAESMMLRLGIHRAELEAVGEVKKEKIVESKRDWLGNYSIVMLPFVDMVASGFGGLIVLESSRSAMLRTSYVIGPKSQVEEFLRLVDSLHIQVMAALKRFQKETRKERATMTEMEKYIQHRSFIKGFGQMTGRRLLALRKVEEGQASTGAALVISNRHAEISSWVDEQYPDLRQAKGGMKYADESGLLAGLEAGKTATLNQKGVDGKGSTQIEK